MNCKKDALNKEIDAEELLQYHIRRRKNHIDGETLLYGGVFIWPGR